MEESKKSDKAITEFELPSVEETSIAAKNKREVGSPAWRAGQSGNPAGRKKGSKNKIQGEAKILLQKLGFKAVSRIMEDWDQLTLNQIVTLAPKLFPYISPPVSRLEVDNKFEGDMRFKIDVDPKVGRVLIFQQKGLLHSGDDVVRGVKYTMRSDIMYEFDDGEVGEEGEGDVVFG